jgi:hypothetical protein
MTAILQAAVVLLAALFALFLAVNFWPLFFLFLWIAIPFWILSSFLRCRRKRRLRRQQR